MAAPAVTSWRDEEIPRALELRASCRSRFCSGIRATTNMASVRIDTSQDKMKILTPMPRPKERRLLFFMTGVSPRGEPMRPHRRLRALPVIASRPRRSPTGTLVVLPEDGSAPHRAPYQPHSPVPNDSPSPFHGFEKAPVTVCLPAPWEARPGLH